MSRVTQIHSAEGTSIVRNGLTLVSVGVDSNSCTGCYFMRPGNDCHDQPGCKRNIWVEKQEQQPAPAATTDSKPTNPKDAIGITKLPMHLVSPIVKCYQAIAHFLGNVKYGAWNYRGAGVRYSVYKAALERHVDAWWEGEELDPVDGTPHLANAQACLNILIEAKYTKSSIDDRPPSRAAALTQIKSEFEPMMRRIRELYADKDPKHFTIADTV